MAWGAALPESLIDHREDLDTARTATLRVADVDPATIAANLEAGGRIPQIFKFSEDNAQHVAELERLARFPVNAHVLDVGCCTGAIAQTMSALRPDLSFMLQSGAAIHLGLCTDFPSLHCTMDELRALAASFDGVMVNCALGRADLLRFLLEAARVLRPGGVFFAYDITARDTTRCAEVLGYVPYRHESVACAAAAAGFDDICGAEVLDAKVSDLWRRLCEDAPAVAEVVAGVRPVVYRFVRGPGECVETQR